MSGREHDLVLYGASGFVGRLVAEQLAEQAPAGLRVALGGRSRQRLERVRAGLPGEASGWPIVVADSSDAAALEALAASTRVVATTVGPYLRYGLPLAMACARAGTHYADLTGEVLYVRQLIDQCQDIAEGTGARIVAACGYDSIPSDLGVLLLHEQASTDGWNRDCTSLLTLRKGGRAAIGAGKWSSQNKVIKSSGCSVVSKQEIVRHGGNLAIRRTAYSYVWIGNIRMKVADAVKMALDSQVRRNQRYYREIGSGLVEDNTTQNRCATGSKCQIVGICAGFFDGEHGKHANQAKPREQLDVHCSLPNWVALAEGGLIGTRFCRGV